MDQFPVEINIDDSARKLLRLKETPFLHLTYNKNWETWGWY